MQLLGLPLVTSAMLLLPLAALAQQPTDAELLLAFKVWLWQDSTSGEPRPRKHAMLQLACRRYPAALRGPLAATHPLATPPATHPSRHARVHNPACTVLPYRPPSPTATACLTRGKGATPAWAGSL